MSINTSSLPPLDSIKRKILDEIYLNGPDCAKFISRRINLDLRSTMDILKELETEKYLEKVQGTFLEKPGLRKPKHMNHTYYKLTKETEHLYRKIKKEKLK